MTVTVVGLAVLFLWGVVIAVNEDRALNNRLTAEQGE